MPKQGLIISPTQTSCAIFPGKSPPQILQYIRINFDFPQEWVSINHPCETKALFFQVFFSSLPQRCGLSNKKIQVGLPMKCNFFQKLPKTEKTSKFLKFPKQNKKGN